MKTTYFKTLKAINEAAKKAETFESGKYAMATQVNCHCGESNGYLVGTDKEFHEKFVLCDACYENADNIERGE